MQMHVNKDPASSIHTRQPGWECAGQALQMAVQEALFHGHSNRGRMRDRVDGVMIAAVGATD